MSIFETLSNINLNDVKEKKNNLDYISWAWAWNELKKHYPQATYVVHENVLPNGFTCNYFTDGKTCYVKCSVIIEEEEQTEYLPVMDFKNKAIPFDSVTMIDVNKAIQRCVTKCIARFGLGLYVYAGEDLPEEESNANKKAVEEHELKIARETLKNLAKQCNVDVTELKDKNGKGIEDWDYNTLIRGCKHYREQLDGKK